MYFTVLLSNEIPTVLRTASCISFPQKSLTPDEETKISGINTLLLLIAQKWLNRRQLLLLRMAINYKPETTDYRKVKIESCTAVAITLASPQREGWYPR